MVIKNQVLDIINQIDEPEKPVIPQFVADWYEAHKGNLEYNLYLYQMSIYDEKAEKDDFYYWMQKSNSPIRTLINMHQFGYTIKKEKLYTVEIPNPRHKGNNKFFLVRDPNTGGVLLCKGNFNKNKNKNLWLTEPEIRKDFEWAWQEGFAKEVENEME
ncbi:DUF1642 domain-containing protein [Streptococcus pluranimalium]|uniref:DUF1642 domain-containing protein n=1 Tax=Streptococcus pluranimalium TaxID=82348 RepID=UPI0039E92E53